MSDQNPICWGLLCSDGVVEVVTETEQELLEYKEDNPNDAEVIIPLYRHPSEPCPYVTGKTTRYCTLTPFSLTADEREAIEASIRGENDATVIATLRNLLARIGGHDAQ